MTQADINAGQVVNAALASGTPPVGPDVTDPDTDIEPLPQAPGILLVKSGTFNDENSDGNADVGETISYAFTVTNTGNVTLTDVTVTDPLVTVIGGPLASLAVGASDSTTFSGTYVVIQVDIDAGQVVNAALASGTPPSGSDVTDDDSHTEPLTQLPGIDLVKTATPLAGATVGQPVTYNYVVTNTGNVTLTSVTVVDDLEGAITLGATTLAPGASTVGSAIHIVTQADIDAGSRTNIALATGTPPTGPNVTDTDSQTVSFVQPSIDIEKFVRAESVDGNVCDTLDKAFVLTMKYIGGAAQSHTQDPSKVAVDDFGPLGSTEPVFIVASSKLNLNDKKNKTWFEGFVTNIGDTFEIDAANAGASKLSAATFVQFFTDATMSDLLQAVEFHASCSQPLELGNIFGGVQLVGYLDITGASATMSTGPGDDADTPQTGPTVPVGSTVTFTYQVVNTGDVPLGSVVVVDDNGTPGDNSDDFNPVFTGGDDNGNNLLDLTETWTYTSSRTVTSGLFTNIGAVTGQFDSTTVSDSDPANHTGEIVPVNTCTSGEKVQVLTVRYTGDGDDATTHTQDPSKVSVVGDPNDATPVYIVSASKSDLSDNKAKIWFEGQVILGDTFEIDATTVSGQTKLSAATFVKIFTDSTKTTLLQEVEFHTSCSQPLFIGDQFGSIKVEGFLGDGGTQIP